MPTINPQLLGTEDGGTVLLETGYAVLLETGDALNTTAELRPLSGNTICTRSGRKAYPHEFGVERYHSNQFHLITACELHLLDHEKRTIYLSIIFETQEYPIGL